MFEHAPPDIAGEEWRPVHVPHLSRRVEVSDFGRVRLAGGLAHLRRRFYFSGPDKDSGYLWVYVPREPFPLAIHRLVAGAWHGPRPKAGFLICHLNGISVDNRAVNLAWGSRAFNTLHRHIHQALIAEPELAAQLRAIAPALVPPDHAHRVMAQIRDRVRR